MNLVQFVNGKVVIVPLTDKKILDLAVPTKKDN